MNPVTNVIIQVGALDGDGSEALAALDFMGQSLRRIAGNECKGDKCWGGVGNPQVHLFAAAFNDVPREVILNTLLSVQYAAPLSVRLFVQERGEDCLTVYWLDIDDDGNIFWYQGSPDSPESRSIEKPEIDDRLTMGSESIELLRNTLFSDPRLRDVFGDSWRFAMARMTDQEIGETFQARMRTMINSVDPRDMGRFMRGLVLQNLEMFAEAMQSLIRGYRQS